jgi:hypothetical protein
MNLYFVKLIRALLVQTVAAKEGKLIGVPQLHYGLPSIASGRNSGWGLRIVLRVQSHNICSG